MTIHDTPLGEFMSCCHLFYSMLFVFCCSNTRSTIYIERTQLFEFYNLMVMITLFFGIFSSVCQNVELQTLLMTIVVFVNLFFFLSFAKHYICIRYVSNAESPQKNVVLEKLGSHVHKFFRKGILRKNN